MNSHLAVTIQLNHPFEGLFMWLKLRCVKITELILRAKAMRFLSLVIMMGPFLITSAYADRWITQNNGDCQVWSSSSPDSNYTFEWDGDCKNGQLSGKGKVIWYLDGEVTVTFVGTYKNGTPDGYGEQTYPDGYTHKGEYKDGDVLRAEVKFVNGNSYKGEIKDNEFYGEGEYTYSNGDRYVGSFIEGMKHGKGKYIFADGSSYEGLWQDDNNIKIF